MKKEYKKVDQIQGEPGEFPYQYEYSVGYYYSGISWIILQYLRISRQFSDLFF